MERIGPYEVLRLLDEGGVGAVYLALDGEGRAVAVKVMQAKIAGVAGGHERQRREVTAVRRVSSPYVAEIVDFGLDGPRPYVVTRHAQGRSVARIVAERGPLPGAEQARLGKEMARALEAVHRAGAVHRDLKVHNVMVVDGDPVVIDLRIALVEGIQVGKRELQAWNLCSPGGCAHRAGDRTRAEDLSGARVAAVDSGDHELNAWSLINLAGCRKARRRGGPGRRPLPAGTTVGLAARP